MSLPATLTPPTAPNATVAGVLLGGALALVDAVALLLVLPIPLILLSAPVLVLGDRIDLGVWTIDSGVEGLAAAGLGAALVAGIFVGARWVVRAQRSWLRAQPSPRQPVTHERPRLDALTERETEVLELMARGLTNGAIADALFISETTVRKHVGRIFAKLGVSSASTDRRVSAVLAYVHGHEQATESRPGR